MAVVPRSKGDEDKISTGLHSIHQEDPTFKFRVDPELHQTIVSGQGEVHLDMMVKRLKAAVQCGCGSCGAARTVP